MITDPEAAKAKIVRTKPKRPDERQIASQNCCGQCFYNIPSGTMMILLPGTVILMIGAILMSMGETDDSWGSNMIQASLILIILGGALTVGGLVFWTVMWCKHRPKPQRKGSVTPQPQVALVAIYRTELEESTIAAAEGKDGLRPHSYHQSMAKNQQLETAGALPS